MGLALFDLDNTLIAGDSDHLWGDFLVAEGLVDATTHKALNEHYYQQYQQGLLDINEYLSYFACARRACVELERWRPSGLCRLDLG